MRCIDCDYRLDERDFRLDPTGTLCARCFEIQKEYLDEVLGRPQDNDE